MTASHSCCTTMNFQFWYYVQYSVAKKTPPHHYTSINPPPELLTLCRTIDAFVLFTLNSDSTNQISHSSSARFQ